MKILQLHLTGFAEFSVPGECPTASSYIAIVERLPADDLRSVTRVAIVSGTQTTTRAVSVKLRLVKENSYESAIDLRLIAMTGLCQSECDW